MEPNKGVGRGLGSLIMVAWIACLLPSTQAAATDPLAPNALPALLRQAELLEESGQWSKAGEVYAGILARDRSLTFVKDRYQQCLRRGQQVRRHRDPSYRQQVLTLSLQEGLQLYAEVLSAVAASDGPLSSSELDAVLGVRPAWG